MEKESAWKNRCLDLEKQYLDLEKRYLVLEKRCEELISENQMLREKLNTNSKNSSKPPSQDPFKRGRSSKTTGKKPGEQPGPILDTIALALVLAKCPPLLKFGK